MEQRQEAPTGAPRRAALALVALVGLLGLVAIGSNGKTRADLGGRRPSYLLMDAVVSLVLVAMVLGVVLTAWVVISERKYLAAQRLMKRRKRRPIVAAGATLVLLALLLSLRGVLHVHARQQPPDPKPAVTPGSSTRTQADVYKPRFATIPVLVVLGFAASVALVAHLAYRSRRQGHVTADDGTSLALTLADVLDDTLDDLRAEPDPRRATIAAYARLERTLGAFGLPRRAAEAPDEYLHRIFVDLEVSSRFVQRLTQLFARAKFSQHSVDEAMKQEAIQLLETIRAALREADEQAREQRASIAAIQPSASR